MKWNQVGAFVNSNHKRLNLGFIGIFLFVNFSSVGFGQTTTPSTNPDFSTNYNKCVAGNKNPTPANSGASNTVTQVDCSKDPQCDDYQLAQDYCKDTGNRNSSVTVAGNPAVSCSKLSKPQRCDDQGRTDCQDAVKDYQKTSCGPSCVTHGEACDKVAGRNVDSSDKDAEKRLVKDCPSAAKNANDENEKQMKYYQDRMENDRIKVDAAQDAQAKDTESSQAAIANMSAQIQSAQTASQQIQINLQKALQGLKEGVDSATTETQKQATTLNNNIINAQTTEAAAYKNKALQDVQKVETDCWTDAKKQADNYMHQTQGGNVPFSSSATAPDVSALLTFAAQGNKRNQLQNLINIYEAQCLQGTEAKNAVAAAQETLQTMVVALNSKITQIRQNVVDLQTSLAKVVQNANNHGTIEQQTAASEALKLTQQVQQLNAQLDQKNAQVQQATQRDAQKLAQVTQDEQEDEKNYNSYKALYDQSSQNPVSSDKADASKQDEEDYHKYLNSISKVRSACCDTDAKTPTVGSWATFIKPAGVCGAASSEAAAKTVK